MHPILNSLFQRAERARERRFLREARRAMSGCGCAASNRNDSDSEASRAERLRCIALFAQAGYFNMTYSADFFEPPIE